MDERFKFPQSIDKPVPVFIWRDITQALSWVVSILFLMFSPKVGIVLYGLYFLIYRVILSEHSGSGIKHLFWKLNFPSVGVLTKYGKPIDMDFYR